MKFSKDNNYFKYLKSIPIKQNIRWNIAHLTIKLLQLKSQSVKTKHKSYIRLTQENSIKFLVQCIYLIYIRLIVCTILDLIYSKEYILAIRLLRP